MKRRPVYETIGRHTLTGLPGGEQLEALCATARQIASLCNVMDIGRGFAPQENPDDRPYIWDLEEPED
jgi:hypothetical protein